MAGIEHSIAQFLLDRNLRSALLYLYRDLQTKLRFNRNKYTVNNHVQSHVEEHSELITLRKQELSNILKEWGRERTSIRRKERSNFSLHSISLIWHNFEEQMTELPSCFVQFLLKRHNA